MNSCDLEEVKHQALQKFKELLSDLSLWQEQSHVKYDGNGYVSWEYKADEPIWKYKDFTLQRLWRRPENAFAMGKYVVKLLLKRHVVEEEEKEGPLHKALDDLQNYKQIINDKVRCAGLTEALVELDRPSPITKEIVKKVEDSYKPVSKRWKFWRS